MSHQVLHGVGAAPGVALGAALIYRLEVPWAASQHAAGHPEEEFARFRRAVQAVEQDLSGLMERADEQGKAILEAHVMMLHDPALHDQVESGVAAGQAAEAAAEAAVEEFAAALESLEDPYLRERAADVRDVGRRLVFALTGKAGGIRLERPAVLVARDLGPSDTIALDRALLLALVTEVGGPTSHIAILARSWGIPAVVAPGALAQISDGAMLVVDGDAGEVVVEPAPAVLAGYQGRVRAAGEQSDRDRSEAHLPAETPDGHRVELGANAGQPEDVAPAVAMGAEGIGLFRTEFLFMGRGSAPTEEEQYEAYAEALRQAAGRRVVFRTLDIGGDKHVPYLGLPEEANPFLGMRALRLCFERPELFRVQCRALLRAGVHGRLSVMFPMVGSLADLRRARGALREAQRGLEAEGVPHAADPEVGIMVEIPSAALIAGHLAREVDFFSIGTNDLIQYTLAVDRGNPTLAEFYQPFHPAVLRLIDLVVEAAHAAGKWVGVCGEMGGDPAAALLLVGLGVDELSMAQVALPNVRRLVRATRFNDAQQLARQALGAGSADEVCALVGLARSVVTGGIGRRSPPNGGVGGLE